MTGGKNVRITTPLMTITAPITQNGRPKPPSWNRHGGIRANKTLEDCQWEIIEREGEREREREREREEEEEEEEQQQQNSLKDGRKKANVSKRIKEEIQFIQGKVECKTGRKETVVDR